MNESLRGLNLNFNTIFLTICGGLVDLVGMLHMASLRCHEPYCSAIFLSLDRWPDVKLTLVRVARL